MSDFLRQRLLLPFMGLLLLLMLASGLWARFSSPSLVIASGERRADPAHPAPSDETGALMQALAADPDNVDIAIRLSRLLLDVGRIEAAQAFASRANELAPGRADAPALLGYIESRLGRYREAAALLEKSLKLEDNPRVRYSLGVIYAYYLDDPARSRGHFAAALAHPDAGADLAARIARELSGAPKETAHPE